MIYTSAVLLFYNLGNDNRYQDQILMLGGFLGMLVGASSMWLGLGLEALKDSMPISITIVLTVGQLWHILQSRFMG